MDMSGKYAIEIPQVKKVAVAYSGGLDSALALKLLPEYYGTSGTNVDFSCNDDGGLSEDWSGDGVGLDNDGRMYLVAQVYHTKKTIDWWIEQSRAFDEEFGIETFVCDPSEPAYIEQYQRAGLNAVAGFNPVRPGINAVQERLAAAGDDKPRLFIVRDSLRQPDIVLQSEKRPHSVEQEFPSYVWADSKAREQPVKEFDDGLDMMRYTVAYVDGGAGEVFPFGWA